jgi:type IV pilus assembly protein PilW
MKKHSIGIAMLDMLIAIGLGLIILLPLALVVRAAVVTHFRQEQIFVIEQDAHYLLDHMARAIQQAGHNDPLDLADDSVIALRGLDNAVISGTAEDISVTTGSGFHGSDALAIHFSASSIDSKMILHNCAGFTVPPKSFDGIDRGWSIFYLVRGTNGSGDFRCKYRGTDQWDSQSLASGVVTLQFLYGLDTDNDGLPNQFVNATMINQKENAAGEFEGSVWRRVVAVHIALVMQAEADLVDQVPPDSLDLFGRFYSDTYSAKDNGTHFSLSDFPAKQRKRLSRVFDRVVFLRNNAILNHQTGPLQSEGNQ